MSLSLTFGFLMDPYESLNLATETSLLMMEELLRRGHRAVWIEQRDLHLRGRQLMAKRAAVKAIQPFELGTTERGPLLGLDALLIRKDPPFDAGYLHLTYLLDFLDPATLAVNSPRALRDLNEKIHTLNWSEDCPDTLVTMDPRTLLDFVEEHGQVIIKPLDNCSGRGIFRIERDSPQLANRLAAALGEGGRYLLAQPFLPAVAGGDKRVFLLDGKPLGWVNRVPRSPEALANIHQGARCEATELTPEEARISGRVGRDLVTRGVLLAGLDFIGERLTEVNITSPSALRQINAVMDDRLEVRLVDALVSASRRHQLRACG